MQNLHAPPGQVTGTVIARLYGHAQGVHWPENGTMLA